MKYTVRIRINNINPFIMLLSAAVIDLLALFVLLIQLITGVFLLTTFWLLALIWIPPVAIIIFYILFAVCGYFTAGSQGKITSTPSVPAIAEAKSSTLGDWANNDYIEGSSWPNRHRAG